MSLSSPWSVKGIQPKTREAAKDLARREGLTLGEWLNRLIGEVEEEGGPDQSATSQRQAPAQNSSADLPPPTARPTRYEDTPLAQFPNSNSAHIPHQSGPQDPIANQENSRLTAALEQLTRRLDATLPPAAPSHAPVHAPAPTLSPPAYQPDMATQYRQPEPFAEQGLMDRIEASERQTQTALGRVDASLADVRQTQAALTERLRVMEANDPTNKSLAALRGLETALNRLSEQVFDTQARTQALDQHVGAMNQRVAHTESVAHETNGRLKEAMVDLSARIASVEQSQDDPRLKSTVNAIGERLSGMEDVTTQAIESVDKGLGLVSQRVAATEALAQSTNERLVEALIDLSARLVQLESIDTREQARDILNAIEVKNKEMTRRLEALDQRIDATRGELAEKVRDAIATGVDGRLADVAKALADRLDMSERRSGEALEKIGAEMARASISLDQRLRELEERGTEDVIASMRNEMAKMARSIDERMEAVERRDAAALQVADGHLKELTRSLNDRIDGAEARAQSNAKNVSSQMEQLALRLQARQDETAQNLVARMEDGETRGHQDLKTSIEGLAVEIRSAEDRAKAVAAPLHRDINTLMERLDQIESSAVAPYSENVSFGEQAVTIPGPTERDHNIGFDAGPERHREAFGTPVAAHGYESDSQANTFAHPDFETIDAPIGGEDQHDGSVATRRAGFGAPFPGTSDSLAQSTDLDGQDFISHDLGLNADTGLGQASPFDAEFGTFGDDNFDANPMAIDDTHAFAGEDGYASDLDADWEDGRPSPRQGDYLANARLAASRAAAEREAKQPLKKNTKKPGKAKKPALAVKTDASGQAVKSKPILSPVGIVAAAALVATTGMLAVNHFNKDKTQDEKPTSLNVAPAPVTPSQEVTPQTAIAPNQEVVPQGELAAPSVTPTSAPAAIPVAPKAVAPATPPVAQPVPAPRAQNVAPTQPVARPRASVQTSEQLRQFQAAENARAAQALQRSEAAKARLTPVTKNAGATRPIASTNIQPPRIATTPSQTPSPAPVAIAVAAPPPRIATPSQPVAIAPIARPTQIAATQPSRAATPRVAATPPRVASPAPRVASVPQRTTASAPIGPVTAANARQVVDQAIARQQAGDLAGAASLMRAAAEAGDARATHRLAKMYERGEGVARDPAQARLLTERAAARGNSQAMHNLGVYYAEGEGANRDLGKAAESFRRAAGRGITDSQFNLAAMAEQGLGGPKSEREAFYWYSVAARNGDRDAASKARELAARLPAAERTAEEQRAAQFRPEASAGD